MPEFQFNQPGQMGLGNQDWGQFTQQFQQMGISDPTNTLNVQSALSQMFGKQIPTGMVTGLDQSMLKGTQFGTYRPMLESKRDTLLSELTRTLGGKQTGQMYGGFSGSSASGIAEQRAKDVYGKGAVDVLGEISTAQTAQRRNIQDILQTWRTTAQTIK
tara:strand:+ start:359 stop:835 length:477 start_codon:yes stop_codon:yes gene_type:complete